MTNIALNANAALEQDTGLTARVIGTWMVAGGVFMGGFVVAALTLAERLNGNALLLTAAGLFIVGAAMGGVGGALLGYFGRPTGVTIGQIAERCWLAAALTVPGLAVGFLASAWIAMTTMAMYLGRPAPLAGVVIGWIVGLVILLAAAVEGWTALHHAVRRGGLATAAAAAPLVLLAVALVWLV